MKKYFDLAERINENYKSGRFLEVLRDLEETITLYKKLVVSTIKEYGNFDIKSSDALEKGGHIAVGFGKSELLKKLEFELRNIPETQVWADFANKLIEDCYFGDEIVKIIKHKHAGGI